MPEIITLSSGIPLWVFPRRDLPTVAGSIVIKAGASLQQPAQAGLAQLTTVMLDEGTTVSHRPKQIALAVESMGATHRRKLRLGRCLCFIQMSREETSPPILDLTVDILLNPTFPQSEWERVRGQTLAALQGGTRQCRVARVPRPFVRSLPGRPPLPVPLAGHEASVSAFTPADLASFHARFLLASEATIVVAGDVDPERLADRAERAAAGIARRTAPAVSTGSPPVAPRRPPPAPARPARGSPGGRTRRPPGARSVRRRLRSHRWCLNQILGGQFTSRLNTKLREERGFTYGVRSHFDCRRQPGPFSITTSVQADRLAEALDDIHHELEAPDRRPASQSSRARQRPPRPGRGPGPPLRDALGAGEPLRQPGDS